MNTKAVLTISILLNVALAGFCMTRLMRPNAEPPPAQSISTPSIARPAPPQEQSQAAPSVVTNLVMQKFDWQTVESDDYKKYIANLRAIGCPEDTIKDIILADVNKMFAARKKAMKKPGDGFKYWKAGQAIVPGLDEDKVKQQQALSKEKREILSQLLGKDFAETEVVEPYNPFGDMLDFLSASKQSQVLELQQKYGAKAMKLIKPGEEPDAAAIAQLKNIVSDRNEELNHLLTPEERRNFDLTLSDTAVVMRMTLTDFDPNEKEFQTILDIRKPYDEEFMFAGKNADSATKAAKQDAQLQMDDQLKAALGDRWADYRNARDWNGSPLKEVSTAENIPRETAVKVFDLRDIAVRQAQQVRNDASLSDNQRQAALQAIQDETRNAVNDVLGEKAGEAFLKKTSKPDAWFGGLVKAAPKK